MSVTTTANPLTQSVLRVLADYELTHSDHESRDSEETGTLNNRSQAAETRPNPEGWIDDYHGVPPYRPINYQLDREQRPWARPGVETAFAFVMLNGVGCVAYFAKVWRRTGGKLNDQIFRFSIGGER